MGPNCWKFIVHISHPRVDLESGRRQALDPTLRTWPETPPDRRCSIVGASECRVWRRRFSDGASYEDMMAPWSRNVGELFLDWLYPAPGLDWIDVGCGSGAFTSLVVQSCRPSTILGIDPSRAQLDYSLQRGLPQTASFELAHATSLPALDRSIDAGVWPAP